MVSYLLPSSGGGANQNLNNTYEFLGFSTGVGSTVTASGSVNTKGSYTQMTGGGGGGVTENAFRGIYLIPMGASAPGVRFLADVSFDGGSTVAIPNIFLQPGTAQYGTTPGVYFPMAVASGANVQVRMQSATASATVVWSVVGVVSNAQSPPCYTTCSAITAASTADTRAGSVNVPLTDAWTELEDSTVADYDAIIGVCGPNGTVLGTSQLIGVQLGIGAVAAESAIMRWVIGGHTSAPEMPRAFSPLCEQSVASGTRLSAKAYGGVAGTDNIRVQLFGFS